MSFIDKLFKRKKEQKRTTVLLNSSEFEEWLKCGEYTPLCKCPEIITACRIYADLISSMTIYLISNTEKGDKRIVNELSRHIDIYPNEYMTRKNWMDAVVMNMLVYGKGNSVVLPTTKNGLLDNMYPVPAGNVSFEGDSYKYSIFINGVKYDHSDLLHFVYNPDPNYLWKGQGVTFLLRDVANNLEQALATENGFMSTKWKPSIIVKVDSNVEEFSTPEGRQKILDDYVKGSRAGEPWLIPAEQFDVEQIRPLSLSDLAINDSVVLDKKTVAAVTGVPAFMLGVGEFNAKEWDNFINIRVKPIAESITQEMTRKLLFNPKWYLTFNIRSIYSYDLKTKADIYSDLYDKGIVTGNEVRNELSLSPHDGLDELMVLENYIPIDKAAAQKKLVQSEE